MKKSGKKITKERKKELLTNAGLAIEKFRNIKKFPIPKLSKKSGINIPELNGILCGASTPTKEEVKSLCKAMDVPKEVILLYSIEEKDVTPRKRELFNQLLPSIKGLVESVIKDDPKKLSKKQVVNKSVDIVTAHKKFKKTKKAKAKK